MEVLDARVEEVLANTTAGSTKYVYLRALARFVEWLYYTSGEDRREVLFTRSFRHMESITGDTIAEWFSRTPLVSPVDLGILSTQECMRYLTSMEQRGVTGKSTFGNVRSAMVYLYTSTEVSRPHDFDSQMKRFFKGLHHTVTQVAQGRNERLREGKEPFAFSMYRAVAKAMLQSTKKRDAFGHSFLLVCWNLMCRAKSAETIRHAHLSWCEDLITITFAHMKNDQDGSRPRDPKHVYANPTIPEICPMLALRIYFAVFGFDGDGKLFPGSNQYSRFLKILKSGLEGDIMNGILTEFGLTACDYGTHSARKGAATYVSSCSTSGLSADAICLRAGWTLPGVQDKYVRFEAAGDQIVGRYVAGLPFDSPKFATLPPFVAPLTNQPNERSELEQHLNFAMDSVFPGVPPSLRKICQFGLASMLYQDSFLRRELPSNHLLFTTPLFLTITQVQVE